MPENGLQQLFARLASPQVLTEAILIAVAILAGLAVGHLVQKRFRRSSMAGVRNWQSRVTGGVVVAVPALVAMLILLCARGILGFTDFDPRLVDIALQLATALLLVRVVTYLLRLALGPDSWLARWEWRFATLLWVLLSFTLMGWFDFVEATLDSIDLSPGKNHFTIWALIKSVVVITLFMVGASLASRAVESRVMHMDGLALSTRVGISKFTYFTLLSLAVLVGINAAGVDLTALTVLTGAVGIGLGFGLQAIASNFVSGLVLLMDKSIKPGDVISFTGEAGTSTENFGWVQELRGRYVVVRDRDGVETLVPNQNMITNPMINWSYSDTRIRLKLPVRISYQDDPEVALELLQQATRGQQRVLEDPAPASRLMQFSDHGIDLELRFWITDPQSGVNNVRSNVNRAIWRLFREHGITMPVAQRDVRVVTQRGGDP